MKKKVLVIDDELSIRFLLQEVIEENGYECIQAEDAVEGLYVIEKAEPDLIILDIQMPQMNGLDAIKKIRVMNKQVPVIMLSAFSHMEDVVSNLGVNFTEFIPKPFDIDELGQKIKHIMGDK